MRKPKFFYKKDNISNLLFEQEDLFADEEAAEEEGGEEAEEGGEEVEEEAEGDAPEEEADPAEEEEEVPEDARMKLGKVIDDDLEALLVDFETEARQSKKVEQENTVEESLKLSKLLFEEAEAYHDEIDLERFTSELARLIKNYDTLLDMEELILTKAKSFIIARYGENAAIEMEDSLADTHGVELDAPRGSLEGDPEVPFAVGAGKASE